MRQCSQIQAGVRLREKRRSRCYPIFTFHIIIIIIIIIIPTEFLRASTA